MRVPHYFRFFVFYAVEKPVKMTDIDNFTTTHYHIKEEYAVDKAKPIEQVHESSY